MEAIPPEIQSYGIAGLLIYLVGKEAIKPLLDSFIKRNERQLDSEIAGKEKEQDLMSKLLVDAITRIPDGIDNLKDTMKEVSENFHVNAEANQKKNSELHLITHQKLDEVHRTVKILAKVE